MLPGHPLRAISHNPCPNLLLKKSFVKDLLCPYNKKEIAALKKTFIEHRKKSRRKALFIYTYRQVRQPFGRSACFYIKKVKREETYRKIYMQPFMPRPH
jgi:hypothetical protein